ncbi:MAG: peptidylprolyl isomerase [Gammaproteobacteria bacterium]|nr:peptidylprolyl isomerase [Gammaproteobacteria bacterium]MYG66144.1 peptidylprolyl isomerase [Gammaproteobacteria bacterium]
MQITKDTVVEFHFEMYEGDQLLQSTQRESPGVLYLHGKGAILDALEQEMEGRAKGDTFTVTLPPEQAFGLRRSDSVERVPSKHVLTPGRHLPGDVVNIRTQAGPREVVVLKVGRFNLDVDLNHPMAGRTVRFDVEIDDVRMATTEELAHGHAHGPGGHQH